MLRFFDAAKNYFLLMRLYLDILISNKEVVFFLKFHFKCFTKSTSTLFSKYFYRLKLKWLTQACIKLFSYEGI